MSHFTTLETIIKDREALIEALKELGFPEIECHDEPQRLRGFLGEWRHQRAHVIIRKKHVGKLSNDIGFLRTVAGTFAAQISGYDRAKFSSRWLGTLTQRYARILAMQTLGEQGFELVEESKAKDGRIHMVLRRVS